MQRPNAAGPLAFGPTGEALLELPSGTEIPTLESALWMAVCAGAGNEFVAAAAVPAVSATAGSAIPSAFNDRSFPSIRLLPLCDLSGSVTAAAIAETAAARRDGEIPPDSVLARRMREARWP